MQITRLSGTISQIAPPDKNGDIHCVVNDNSISLTGELIKQTKDGDQVTLAGELRDDTVYVLAINNSRDDQCRTIDASNIAIILSFSLFVGVITLILALQTIGTGSNITLAIFSVICIAAMSYTAAQLARILRINRASRSVQYG